MYDMHYSTHTHKCEYIFVACKYAIVNKAEARLALQISGKQVSVVNKLSKCLCAQKYAILFC